MKSNIINAVIVGCFGSARQTLPVEYVMNELAELVSAAHGKVCQVVIQNKQTIDVRTYIGKGKVEEVAEVVKLQGANLVVFNNELSGSQIRNLEEKIGVDVIDRTMLILDIFALRAKTSIAKMQVELAQHKYRLPRLIGLGEVMSRTGGGIGTRGPGEQQLELDRRKINKRISDLRNKLDEAIENQEITKKQRQKNGIPIVALVGYTNAGKSTIMNYFVRHYSDNGEDKTVFEKDMLFATLDTYHRRIDLDEHKSLILVDTIGFVSQLPHSLVDAFNATLSEVIDADLLLNIIDASDENSEKQAEITTDTIQKLGAADKPIIKVYNKIDIASPNTIGTNGINVSAKKAENMSLLIEAINSTVFSNVKKIVMQVPYTGGAVLNAIINAGKLVDTKHLETGTRIIIELESQFVEKYRAYIIED